MKNIPLAYVLNVLNFSWFWLGTWVLYYLKFTDYAGIGLIEVFMIVAATTSEIPTGALADLIGKKKTLLLSFLVSGIGSLIMGFAPNLLWLIISVIFLAIGASLYSGTMEALVYDTLKENNLENKFSKINANLAAHQLITFSISSILGGIMYNINPGLPYLALGILFALAAILCFFLVEPKIDTVIFNWHNYKKQIFMGVHQLFRAPEITKQTISLLSIGIFTLIAYEVLNDVLLVEYGFSANELGLIAALINIAVAGIVQLSPILISKIGNHPTFLLTGIIISLSFVLSPFVTLFAGGLMVLLRRGAQAILDNSTSALINSSTESKYRATTISTFELIKKTPYVFTAFFIGKLMDTYSAKNFALLLGILMIILLVGIKVYLNRQNRVLLAHNR